MEILVKNIGNTVKGHVLDCNKKQFEKELKRIEERLYLIWNPVKNKGFGCWEIRILPSTKKPILVSKYNGHNVYELQYVENDLIHHVLDVPYLNYAVLARLREMDTQGKTSAIADLDYLAQRKELKYQASVDDARRQMVKDNKKYFSDLKEYVRSGYNPAWFFTQHRK